MRSHSSLSAHAPSFTQDHVDDLLKAFDRSGTLAAELREIWSLIRDGVPGEVRAFWAPFAGSSTGYGLSASDIESLIRRDITYTERKFTGPLDQHLIEKMTRRGRASCNDRRTEIAFTAGLLRTHHHRHERLCAALADDPQRLTRLSHALYSFYALENSVLLNGAALQRADHELADGLEHRSKLNAINESQCWLEMDLDGTILTANRNFLFAMGYQLGQIVGQHHRLFCTPAYAVSDDYRTFWDRLRGGEFVQGECQRLSHGGNLVHLQATYSPVLGSDGMPVKIIKCATDVTAMRNAEQAEAERAQRFREEADQRRLAHERTLSQLASIVDDIGSVTLQTRMLALNASIEAARVGEAGRSFAVVAGEVRNLSGMIKDATVRASSLLNDGQKSVGRNLAMD